MEDADNVPSFSGGSGLRTAQRQDYETLSSDLLTLFGDLRITTSTPIAAWTTFCLMGNSKHLDTKGLSPYVGSWESGPGGLI